MSEFSEIFGKLGPPGVSYHGAVKSSCTLERGYQLVDISVGCPAQRVVGVFLVTIFLGGSASGLVLLEGSPNISGLIPWLPQLMVAIGYM